MPRFDAAPSYDAIAPSLYALGWRGILPIVPGEKRPAIAGWQRFNGEDQTEAQLQRLCRRYPDCGIGMAAGNGVMGFDLDLTEAAAAARALAIVENHCGSTPLLRIGKPPKSMAFYRSAAPGLRRNPGGLSIEVYPAGRPASGQVVLHGIHPATGKPYAWTRSRPEEVALGDMPWVSAGALDATLAALACDPLVAGVTGKARRGRPARCVSLHEAARARVTPGGLVGWLAAAPRGGRHATALAAVGEVLALGLDWQDEAAALEALEICFMERKPEATCREWDDIVEWARATLAPRMPRRELLRLLGLEVRHAA